MTCRAHRLIIAGFIGASISGAAAVASAQELAPAQVQALTIPKRIDLAAKPSTFGILKTSPGLQAPATSLAGPPAPTTLSPLNGLSLGGPSLSAPPATSSTADDPSQSAVTQRNGDIHYNVAPDSGFTPFIGIGAGRATGLLNSGISQPTPYDSGDALHAYQGQAGFDYKLDKDTHLDFDYRMSNTQRPNVPMLDNANIADQGRDHAAILSLHYSLDPVLRRPPD
jgi:hypothetical protein